ncbi:myogenesis-regulating glycosidase-like [Diorhabda sublineata]|uniref:myogenesis-regulating glycosidase-like n=1 Tax=Diorhabda sublineata TaxID=1163346 RepID=UPI0024E0831A|nr:myogenesis-regulating glycosidase-like [Diorhabda sublineata]
MIPYALILFLLATDSTLAKSIKSINSSLTLKGTNNGIELQVKNDRTGKVVFKGTLGEGRDFSSTSCIGQPKCQMGDITFSFNSKDNILDDTFDFVWETQNKNEVLKDCFHLENYQWFGGPQRRVQIWPLQNMTIEESTAYVSRKDDNHGVAERYWLNSQGGFIFLDDTNPLFVSQNEDNSQNKVCFISKLQAPYINRTRNYLHYTLGVQNDAKEAHLFAINKFLGKPTGHPNEKMVSEPIWTTWAKYKRNIDDATVLEFAQSIRNQGYKNGQLEIDDFWETCYGSQQFSQDKFSSISETVKKVKDMGFRVTLWIHPFVNEGCEPNSQYGAEHDYFVKGEDGLNNATWWNGDKIGHQIDFTHPEAAEWWNSRVMKLRKEQQFDSFKFDAGESDYGQQPSVYPNVNQELIPNILTSTYIRICAKYGDLIEVRSAWRTQDLPIFVRMLDKDSSWGIDNGLASLVTTLFQLNLNGYTMVLPDMIGGNGYTQLPTPELLVRWTQANTFMPAMQFSYLPWEMTSDEFDVPGIVKRYVNLHEKYSNVILKAMQKSIEDGSPVNPPIWWLDPSDSEALSCNDEFLLGEEILVAPILKMNTTLRDIYLPKGTWTDGQTGTVYEGPTTILNYVAGIDILPYFILKKT